MPLNKRQMIYNWKRNGLIYDNYNELYEIYIKAMNCQHCNIEFSKSNDRCMDHDHSTGLFRSIVCRSCNNNDSYIKYPNGYDRLLSQRVYNLTHREEWTKWSKEKTTCICGSVVGKRRKSNHIKTQLHLNNMDKYMNNVD